MLRILRFQAEVVRKLEVSEQLYLTVIVLSGSQTLHASNAAPVLNGLT
jgi:hypothetical protein